MDALQYVEVGGASIAYRVHGHTGPYIAHVAGVAPGLLTLEHPLTRRHVERLCRFSRQIAFDLQGSGRSDPLPPGIDATVEDEAQQLIGVLTAAGVPNAFVLGFDLGGAAAISAAVRRPDLVSGLVLVNTFARAVADADYPWSADQHLVDRLLRGREPGRAGVSLRVLAPSVANDPEVRDLWIGWSEHVTSPAQAIALLRILETLDVRKLLPQVRTPTLIVHSAYDAPVPIEHGRYLAERIPNARLVELPTRDHLPIWEAPELLYDEVEAFVTGARPVRPPERLLAAVLFSDLCASTQRASELGDQRWRRLLDEFERASSDVIEHYQGRLIKTTGDGALATFPTASKAIHCALALRPVARRLGLEVHCGVHVGDVEQRGDDIGGTTVNIASRVMERAAAGEVLVTEAAYDAAIGAGIRCSRVSDDRLKGLAKRYSLYRAEHAEAV